MNLPLHPHSRGFLLLEMILALAVFGMATTGFVVALHRMGDVARLAQSKMRITRILNSALDETLSLPTLEEGSTDTKVPGEDHFELTTTVKLLDKLENQDGQILQQMYEITVEVKGGVDLTERERFVKTWRYLPMYQP